MAITSRRATTCVIIQQLRLNADEKLPLPLPLPSAQLPQPQSMMVEIDEIYEAMASMVATISYIGAANERMLATVDEEHSCDRDFLRRTLAFPDVGTKLDKAVKVLQEDPETRSILADVKAMRKKLYALYKKGGVLYDKALYTDEVEFSWNESSQTYEPIVFPAPIQTRKEYRDYLSEEFWQLCRKAKERSEERRKPLLSPLASSLASDSPPSSPSPPLSPPETRAATPVSRPATLEATGMVLIESYYDAARGGRPCSSS